MIEFANLDELKEFFTSIESQQRFKLEGISFRFIGTNSNGQYKTRKYRNEKEQLTIYIQTMQNVTINVLSRYELGDQWL